MLALTDTSFIVVVAVIVDAVVRAAVDVLVSTVELASPCSAIEAPVLFTPGREFVTGESIDVVTIVVVVEATPDATMLVEVVDVVVDSCATRRVSVSVVWLGTVVEEMVVSVETTVGGPAVLLALVVSPVGSTIVDVVSMV